MEVMEGGVAIVDIKIVVVMEGGVAIVDIKIVVVIEEVEGVEGEGRHLPVLILQEEGASEALAVVSCTLKTPIPTVLQVIVDSRG